MGPAPGRPRFDVVVPLFSRMIDRVADPVRGAQLGLEGREEVVDSASVARLAPIRERLAVPPDGDRAEEEGRLSWYAGGDGSLSTSTGLTTPTSLLPSLRTGM